MMRRVRNLALALPLAVVACSAQTLAIVNATAYIVPGEPAIKDTTIVVANGKVQASAAHVAIPSGAKVIDAHGGMVTPGLMNSDSQLGLVETGTADTTDAAVTSGPFGASFDVEYALNPNSTLLPVARADGLTRAVVLPTSSATPPFDGYGAVLRLSEGANILDVPKAAMAATVGGMVAPQSGGSRAAEWLLIRAALDAARAQLNQSTTTRSELASDAAQQPIFSTRNLAALVPVIQHKIPLVISAERESDLRQAIALADDEKIRVVIVGADEGWRVADLLAAHKIPVVLDPYSSSPTTYDQIGARLDNAALLDRAGVTISFKATFVHVSYNAGIAIRIGAGIAVANGLPWDRALRALTLNPAITWGIEDHYGTLRPGMDADLVVWDGDPLEPSSAPSLVLVRGKQVSLETRQTDLEKRYRPSLSNATTPPGLQ